MCLESDFVQCYVVRITELQMSARARLDFEVYIMRDIVV